MSSWRVRQSYGYGSARAALAPVFAPSPFSAHEALSDSLSAVAEELGSIDRAALARRAAALLALSLALGLAAFLLTPPPLERDVSTQELVLLMPEAAAPEPLAPEPEPEPATLPEPEPAVLAEAEPVVAPVQVPPVVAEPAPAAPPQIDAIAKAPEPAVPSPQPPARAAPPLRPAPSLRIDPVAPRFAVATTPTPANAEPTALRAATRPPQRTAVPVAFSLEPVAAATPEPAPSEFATQPVRTAARSLPVRSAPAAPPRFDPVAPPARYAEAAAPSAPPAAARVTRTAAREAPTAAAPSRAFQGVPLGSLAACLSDREEDSLKLAVMAAAGARSHCSSRAGSYRLVETKNLNAFLMWIERNSTRQAADRCIELRLALECLAGTPNRRTDNG